MNKIITLLLILGMIACQSKNGNNCTYLEGTANLTYNPQEHTFYFPGSGEGATLFFDNQVKSENVNISKAGSFKLIYPGTYHVSYFKNGKQEGDSFTFHHGDNFGSAYEYQYTPINATLGRNIMGTLNDGFRGSEDPGDGQWLVWEKEDVEVFVDFGEKTMISRLELSYYDDLDKKIYPPKSIIIKGSYNGDRYFDILHKTNISGEGLYYNVETVPVNNDFRYYKIAIENYFGKSMAKDQLCYLLIDEIAFTKGKLVIPDGQ